MANIKSAEKQMRQAEKAKIRNRAAGSRLKTALKKAKAGAEEGELDLKVAYSEIDKAAKKKVIKGNTADRYKSRLSAAAKRSKAS
ncbi:MAG: 30S ribosomal protein S20 [Acidobacteriota bacterium]